MNPPTAQDVTASQPGALPEQSASLECVAGQANGIDPGGIEEDVQNSPSLGRSEKGGAPIGLDEAS